MPKLTAVLFRAYDKTHKEFFIDKTDIEIHVSLMNICSTYIPIAILESEESEYMPVSKLDQFPRPEKEKQS